MFRERLITEGTETMAEPMVFLDCGAASRADGVRFRVWAPHASRVDLIGPPSDAGEVAHPMESEPRGYWTAFIANARIDDPYSYRIITRWGATTTIS
jgi:1,4-alpha-glucan branching enzyme